jgi:hypothetical protein
VLKGTINKVSEENGAELKRQINSLMEENKKLKGFYITSQN